MSSNHRWQLEKYLVFRWLIKKQSEHWSTTFAAAGHLRRISSTCCPSTGRCWICTSPDLKPHMIARGVIFLIYDMILAPWSGLHASSAGFAAISKRRPRAPTSIHNWIQDLREGYSWAKCRHYKRKCLPHVDVVVSKVSSCCCKEGRKNIVTPIPAPTPIMRIRARQQTTSVVSFFGLFGGWFLSGDLDTWVI